MIVAAAAPIAEAERHAGTIAAVIAGAVAVIVVVIIIRVHIAVGRSRDRHDHPAGDAHIKVVARGVTLLAPIGHRAPAAAATAHIDGRAAGE
jgi:heme/copper-type cytochrome/quinol oxidase subunit 2